MRAVHLGNCRVGVEAAIAGLPVVRPPVPRPVKGEVLVRIEAAPVHRSDLHAGLTDYVRHLSEGKALLVLR